MQAIQSCLDVRCVNGLQKNKTVADKKLLKNNWQNLKNTVLLLTDSRVAQELDLYKTLTHRHVVGYIDAQFDSRTNTLYIFLEYVPGGSIASMVGR